MPYISENSKYDLDEGAAPTTPGELNYLLTQQTLRYLRAKGLTYHTINDVIGALESAKLEFYRRVAVPYEDGKIKTNGDVYP